MPEAVSGAILGVTRSPEGVPALIVVLVLVAGCIIDGTVRIVMLTPILLPLMRELNVDPVHFGLVFIIAAAIGNVTPPVGAATCAVCFGLRCPVGACMRESAPLLAAVAVVPLFLNVVPALVLFVPDLKCAED